MATGRAMKIGEGVYDLDSLFRAHKLGCMDVVALKLSKFGGRDAVTNLLVNYVAFTPTPTLRQRYVSI